LANFGFLNKKNFDDVDGQFLSSQNGGNSAQKKS
jgi:hypothetical protein